MKAKRQRSRKGGTSAAGTKRHLVPGIENQLGAALAYAEDKVTSPSGGDSPQEVRWLGEPGREKEEFRKIRQRTLKEQVRLAVVGSEKFSGMGPGCVFDVAANRELDGEACFARLGALEKQYNSYLRWDSKNNRWKPVLFEEPVEYRTVSIPKFRSKVFQRALQEGKLGPEEFRKLLRVISKILRREFRRSTKYPGADRGLEVELVLWHLQQGALHCHVVFRKADEDQKRLGLIGSSGKLVWNELELALVAERRRRALDFAPTPKILQSGHLVEDWSLLDRWTRSRVEGDDSSGKSRRARDRGLGEPWDMQLNDVVDLVLERFAFQRPTIWKIWQDEEEKAREENRKEFLLFRDRLGISQREELGRLLAGAKEQVQALTEELKKVKSDVDALTKELDSLTKRLAGLEHDLSETRSTAKKQAEKHQMELEEALTKARDAEARLAQARLNPVILLNDQRTRIIAMTDALQRVLTGVPPTALDLLFLQPSAAHIGGYHLAPAFIVEAQVRGKKDTDTQALMDLVRTGGFTAFETAASAIQKQRHAEVLTPEEQRLITSEGTIRPHIVRAAKAAVAIAKSGGRPAKPRKAQHWGAEAAEFLEVVRLDAEIAAQLACGREEPPKSQNSKSTDQSRE